MPRPPWILRVLLLLAVLPDCGSSPRPGALPGGAENDGGTDLGTDLGAGIVVEAGTPVTMDGGACPAGAVLCNGNQRYTCDPNGQAVELRACAGATPVCVPGVGCGVCAPGSSRCDPANPQQVQVCQFDGMAYMAGRTCGGTGGPVCTDGACPDPCSDAALGRSYLGCDYWPTVTANSQLDAQFQFAVALSNPQDYAVNVTITGGGLGHAVGVNLVAHAVQTVTLPWVDDLIQFDRAWGGCNGPSDPRCFAPAHATPPAHSVLRAGGAYHVHSDGPIAAYQFNPLTYERAGAYHSFTNDASLLLPTGALTQRYLVSTWPNAVSPGGATLGGFVAIVGVSPTVTGVRVRLTSAISAGQGVRAAPAGSTQSYELHQGDVAQLLGVGAGDLTGTVIETDRPVAVFVGHDCTNVPADRPACDHLEEQLFPNETWGTEYVVSALRDRGPGESSVIRVISQADGNAIAFDPPGVHAGTTLRAGQVLEFTATQDFRVTGTRAFLVAQYMVGQGPDPSVGAGDPAMVLEVPAAQYRARYDFFVPATFASDFLDIAAPRGTALTLDGAVFSGASGALGDWSIYHLPIAPGAHHLQSADGRGLGIKVYGIAVYTAYMYPGGLDLHLLTVE